MNIFEVIIVNALIFAALTVSFSLGHKFGKTEGLKRAVEICNAKVK